jgi:S-phase kinase-associated protein 1
MSIKLQANDGTSYPINRDCVKLSILINTYIENNEEDDGISFPLERVSNEILQYVIEFLEHFTNEPMREIPRPLNSNEISNYVQEWYSNFINKDKDTIMEIILAANYMDIQPLLDLGCAKIATMIKGKTPSEIRQEFNIENDFTPEEEEQVKSDSAFLNEV